MPSTAAQAEAAAARAVEQAGAQKLRADRTHELIGAMVSLVSGFAQGDDEMAVCALASVVGQVMATHPAPPTVLAFVVRLATQTASQIKQHELARLQAQTHAQAEAGAPVVAT
jgi:hypothetical protein